MGPSRVATRPMLRRWSKVSDPPPPFPSLWYVCYRPPFSLNPCASLASHVPRAPPPRSPRPSVQSPAPLAAAAESEPTGHSVENPSESRGATDTAPVVRPTGNPKRDGAAAIAAVLNKHKPFWVTTSKPEADDGDESETFEDFTKRQVWETGPNYGNLWQSGVADIRHWR